jgi:hypothetical protein
MTRIAIVTALIASCLAACGAPTRQSGPPSVQGPAVPHTEILARGQVVRSVIAERARSRGAMIASNTVRGVVLERVLPETSPVLQQSCGPHIPGRKVRIILSTDEQAGRTIVAEQRYIVDGTNLCAIQLNAVDVSEANRSLDELKQQVEGTLRAAR